MKKKKMNFLPFYAMNFIFGTERYFEPSWFQIYNYFFHSFTTSKVTAPIRKFVGVKKPCFLLFFHLNRSPSAGCNFWRKINMEKIFTYWESARFKVPLYQKWSSQHKTVKSSFFYSSFSIFIFQNFWDFSFGNYSSPRYLFNDNKFIKIEALVEKWQVKQKLVHT